MNYTTFQQIQDVDPMFGRLAQHQSNIGSMSCTCRDVRAHPESVCLECQAAQPALPQLEPANQLHHLLLQTPVPLQVFLCTKISLVLTLCLLLMKIVVFNLFYQLIKSQLLRMK